MKAGDKVYLSITYDNGDKTFESQQFTVSAKLADDSLAIRETEITTETGTITVEVTGCDDFKGGYLFLFTGAKVERRMTATAEGDWEARLSQEQEATALTSTLPSWRKAT